MTRLQRYESQLAELEARRARLLRSNQIVKSMELDRKIKEIRAMIEEIRPYYEPKPLSESVTPQELKEMNIVPMMIMCHLIADLLTESCYMIVDKCKEHGLDNVSFVPELHDIIKRCDKFAGFLLKMSPELQQLLLRNETLNASIIKKYLKHIEQRLKHFKKQ